MLLRYISGRNGKFELETRKDVNGDTMYLYQSRGHKGYRPMSFGYVPRGETQEEDERSLNEFLLRDGYINI